MDNIRYLSSSIYLVNPYPKILFHKVTTHILTNPRAWRIPSIFQALPSVFQAIGIFFLPESPRWLVSKGREDAALDVLAYYHANGDREDEVVQFEFREIVGTIELEIAAKQMRWSELWKGPGNKWRIFIMIVSEMAYFGP